MTSRRGTPLRTHPLDRDVVESDPVTHLFAILPDPRRLNGGLRRNPHPQLTGMALSETSPKSLHSPACIRVARASNGYSAR